MVTRAHIFLSCAVLLSAVFSFPVSAKAAEAKTGPDLGHLELNHAHIPWPAPDSLVKSLRADDEQTRIRALEQMGVAEQGIANRNEKPSEIELRYAALGGNDEQQAIVEARMGPLLFGAVAAQYAGVWHRLASFTCWCKYEAGDLLGDFVQIEAGPERGSELVLHASGGGTGIYTQNEAHFRYYRGELQLVFSFMSRVQRCDPTAPKPYKCEVERRWFYAQNFDSTSGAVLVESRFTFVADRAPEAQFRIRDLGIGDAKIFSCKTYQWDQEKFRYAEFSAPNPCKPKPEQEVR